MRSLKSNDGRTDFRQATEQRLVVAGRYVPDAQTRACGRRILQHPHCIAVSKVDEQVDTVAREYQNAR
jgi:hypothetical protein